MDLYTVMCFQEFFLQSANIKFTVKHKVEK